MVRLPRTGSYLGHYEIVRPIGRGGMGVVYEAKHRTLGRRVAVKVLHASEAARPGADVRSERFMREGRAAASVQHPHVVDVFDFGVDDGVPFLVMELIEGETLAQRIARARVLDLEVVVELILPVLSAVAELHAAGIVHRDLKPANILLARGRTGECCPKVADFGVSRIDDGSAPVTDSHSVLGTYSYMAPEQGRASRAATEQSDQYALGVILYECATGTKPFVADSPYELLHAIMTASIAPPSARNGQLPPELDAVVLRAMSRDPAARFACVEELAEALLVFAKTSVASRWAAEFRAPLSRDPSPSTAPVSSTRMLVANDASRSKRNLLIGATIAMLLVAATVVARPHASSTPPARLAAVAASLPVVDSAPMQGPSSTPPPPPPNASSGQAGRSAAPARRVVGVASAPTHSSAPKTPAFQTGENGAPILDP
jgi:serine/threonine protein kinase